MAQASGKALPRTLGAFDLFMMGIGVIVGTGIFVMTGVAAAKFAGPAIILSFAFSAVACALICLTYSELAAALPAAGSSYAYSYAAAGEFVAWLVGWNLILEYTVGASAVAAGWSAYFTGILKSGGIELAARTDRGAARRRHHQPAGRADHRLPDTTAGARRQGEHAPVAHPGSSSSSAPSFCSCCWQPPRSILRTGCRSSRSA